MPWAPFAHFHLRKATTDRQKVIDFTDNYYIMPGRVVTKKDMKYAGPVSTKGKMIGVLKISNQEKYPTSPRQH